MARYFVTDVAARNLRDIRNSYIEQGGTVESANRLLSDIYGRFENLADFPQLGTPRDYLPGDFLAVPHKSYMIFYCVTDYGVDIINVLYGAIDFDDYFSRE